jgi:hypothetical protein
MTTIVLLQDVILGAKILKRSMSFFYSLKISFPEDILLVWC